MPPDALISSAASSAASFIGVPIGSLKDPATPMRTGLSRPRPQAAASASQARQRATAGAFSGIRSNNATSGSLPKLLEYCNLVMTHEAGTRQEVQITYSRSGRDAGLDRAGGRR